MSITRRSPSYGNSSSDEGEGLMVLYGSECHRLLTTENGVRPKGPTKTNSRFHGATLKNSKKPRRERCESGFPACGDCTLTFAWRRPPGLFWKARPVISESMKRCSWTSPVREDAATAY